MLGPRPGSHAQAYQMQFSGYPTPPPPPQPSWDHLAMLQAAYNAHGFPNNGSAPNEWYLDSGVASHVTGNPGNLDHSNSSVKHRFSSIVVGNGTHLPIQSSGSITLPPHNFHLKDILFSPHVVTSLMSVRQFTKDNSSSIAFFPMAFL